MKNLNPEAWEYRVKCRQCGRKHEIHFSTRSMTTYMDFAKAMIDHLQYPRQTHCKKCRESTVHDVIAYTEPYGD
jgi:hypothetical protein